MSGFGKNVIPRRIHKERSQPTSRVSKHGLLEKKQDYKLRARDRNRKRLRIKILREKAAFRNPDEFYYGMVSKKTSGGVIHRTRNEFEKDAIPRENRTKDQRMLADTQDARYVRMKHQLEGAKLDKMKNRLHFIDVAAQTKRKHVLFVEDEEELECLASRKMLQSAAESKTPDMPKALRKRQARSYGHFEQRSSRMKKLNTVLQDMNSQKMLLAKGRRFKLREADSESGAPAVFKWQQERSR